MAAVHNLPLDALSPAPSTSSCPTTRRRPSSIVRTVPALGRGRRPHALARDALSWLRERAAGARAGTGAGLGRRAVEQRHLPRLRSGRRPRLGDGDGRRSAPRPRLVDLRRRRRSPRRRGSNACPASSRATTRRARWAKLTGRSTDALDYFLVFAGLAIHGDHAAHGQTARGDGLRPARVPVRQPREPRARAATAPRRDPDVWSSNAPAPDLNELGFYVLAGAPKTPADLLDEMAKAEALGLGAAFISERFNIKEAATLSGAAAAVSQRIGIATAATNHNTRHPLITASYATTMHRLSGGRFTLGLGRGIDAMFGAYGMPKITTAQMEDIAGLLRRMWHGEVVFGHDGPAGKFPILHLDAILRRGHPARPRRVRAEHARARRPRLRHGRAAHVLHRRDDDVAPSRRCGGLRRRPGAIPRRCASGRATRRSPTPSPRTCG